jgi:hypothetical protein
MTGYQENAIDFTRKREIFCRTVELRDSDLIAVGWTNAAGGSEAEKTERKIKYI